MHFLLSVATLMKRKQRLAGPLAYCC